MEKEEGTVKLILSCLNLSIKTYEYKSDPEEIISHSMFNIKEEIKRRSETVQRKRPRRIEMTTMYDVSSVGSGSEVELDAHVLPPT